MTRIKLKLKLRHMTQLTRTNNTENARRIKLLQHNVDINYQNITNRQSGAKQC
jgi:hypothetical protein